MPTPTFPTLGASTVVRKWCIEVNTGSTGSPIWKMLGAVNANKFNPDTAVFQDDSDMQSGGAGSQTKTAGDSAITLTVLRKVKSDGVSYDDAQEFVKSKAINKYGPDNSVQLRIFEFNPAGGPRVDAYTGFFGAGWDYQGGDNKALDAVQLSFMGQGACAAITHPYPSTAVVPTVTAVVNTATGNSTLAVAGGQIIHIYGSAFTGTTGITIAGNAVTAFSVDNDGQITALSPAHASGTGLAVVVTNATGASSGGATVTYV